MNENICRPKCIMSKHTGNVEQKLVDKCINEYSSPMQRKYVEDAAHGVRGGAVALIV